MELRFSGLLSHERDIMPDCFEPRSPSTQFVLENELSERTKRENITLRHPSLRTFVLSPIPPRPSLSFPRREVVRSLKFNSRSRAVPDSKSGLILTLLDDVISWRTRVRRARRTGSGRSLPGSHLRYPVRVPERNTRMRVVRQRNTHGNLT